MLHIDLVGFALALTTFTVPLIATPADLAANTTDDVREKFLTSMIHSFKPSEEEDGLCNLREAVNSLANPVV